MFSSESLPNIAIGNIISELEARTGEIMTEERLRRLSKVGEIISFLESDKIADRKNEQGSTAEGAFQYLKGSIPTAVNRYVNTTGDEEKFKDLITGAKSISDYSYSDQATLFWADMLQKKGTDDLVVAASDGSIDAMRQMYDKHHTEAFKNPATLKRLNEFLPETLTTEEFDSLDANMFRNYGTTQQSEKKKLIALLRLRKTT